MPFDEDFVYFESEIAEPIIVYRGNTVRSTDTFILISEW